ncbi:ATP-binding protein [Streptomyces sp. NPDC057702]|uniref:ATP-binding protein n=1 Tax=unclassified Streptomyces TaxID=2593676 RepID=UPI0036B3C905
MNASGQRPAVSELRLSAYKTHRRAVFPLGPVTLFTGPSGSGKSSALEAYAALARLAAGEPLTDVFPDPSGCVPQQARPDVQGRRGFRIGCTVDGPVGPVHLDVAVQAEPELRIVGERMTGAGEVLLETALRDPGRRTVQAAWYTAGAVPVTRAPLPDDRLATALLPLRIAGKTAGQRLALAAAEQVVVALRSVFPCDPRPEAMRGPAMRSDGHLRSACDNLAAVLYRTRKECGTRHAALVEAVREGCAGPAVTELTVEGAGQRDGAAETAERAPISGRRTGTPARGLGEGRLATADRRGMPAERRAALGGAGRSGVGVRAVLGLGEFGHMPMDRLGDGELRYLGLALVLLTGPGVLDVDPVADVLPALQTLTVLADGFDRCLDRRQARLLLELAGRMCERGHIRLVGTVREVPLTLSSAGEGEGQRPVVGEGGGRGDVPGEGAAAGEGRSKAGHGHRGGGLVAQRDGARAESCGGGPGEDRGGGGGTRGTGGAEGAFGVRGLTVVDLGRDQGTRSRP